MNEIAQNISEIKKAISNAAPAEHKAHLIAVSKQQPPERIQEALGAGHRIFGENRVQEAQQRWADIKPDYPDLELHLIGPLQSNKAKDAVELFDVIHTVDRPKIVDALAKEMGKQDRHLPCFIQVNTGDETQKSGAKIDDLEALLTFAKNECGLNIIGLMCIPPVDDPPALHFTLLKKLATQYGLENLSMGMSSDYKRAAALGATHIRIGTGIFGARP